MKKIFNLLFILIAAWSLTGCTRENVEQAAGTGDVIIRLQVDAMQTKSAGTTDENYVESLQVLVFKDVAAAPDKYLNLTSEITPGETTYEKEYSTLTVFGGFTGAELTSATVFAVANYSGDLSGVASLAAAKKLAVDASGFLATSPDGEVVKPKPRFIMIAEGGFAKETIGGIDKAVASLTLTRLAAKVSLVIKYDETGTEGLITTEDTSAGTTTVWTPMSEGNVRVYLSNAVNNAKLGGAPHDTPVHFFYADDHPTGEGTLTSTAFYTYPATWDEGSDDAPFLKIIQPWSYKTVKEEGGKPVIVDQNVVELYYKVMLPGVTSLAPNMWYQPTVTLNVLGGESSRNMTDLTPTGFDILPWGLVGSTAGGLSPIKIDPAKYIAIERDTTIVNNGGGVSIFYVASGPTTLTIEKVHKVVFINNSMEDREIVPTKHADVNDTYSGSGASTGIASGDTSDPWFGNTYGTDAEKPNEGFITLKHTLSTNFNDNHFAARPYEYKLRLHLNGELTDELDKVFYIIQNPAVFADGQMSTGFVCVNGTTSNAGSLYKAREAGDTDITGVDLNAPFYIYTKWFPASSTNPTHSYDQIKYLGNVGGYRYLNPANTNTCRWRIILRTPTGHGYYILDPRTEIPEVSGKSDETSDPYGLYGLFLEHATAANTAAGSQLSGSPLFSSESDPNNALLAKYRPTKREYRGRSSKTASDPADPLPGIAPEFMIASSYGRTSSVPYTSAMLWCAAYQEDGFPAGRWRLPTESEIELALKLADKGAIPHLFAGGFKYWASSGRYFRTDDNTWQKPTATNTVSSYGAACVPRCVYDTWYWGSEEVNALKLGVGSTFGTDFSTPQYQWSGWNYTTK